MNYKFQIGDKIVEFSQEQLHSWARCMSIPTSEITLRDIADFCAWTAFGKNYRFLVALRTTGKNIQNWVEDRLFGQVAKYGPDCNPKHIVHRGKYSKLVTNTIEFKQVHES